MRTTFMGMLLMLLVAVDIHAADTASSVATSDGRTFDSLSADDIQRLSGPDQAAYQTWQAAHPAETSTYQPAAGPNTMDLSSDFSM
ncbi:MAG: hypothetical protein ACT6RZ_09425 [Methylophilus sp.]|uniref:hypothetical protein n=1 Tax=Methylophilus sp. TaxID=29541 RepID=UPI0040374686